MSNEFQNNLMIKIKLLFKRIIYRIRIVKICFIDYRRYRKYSFALSNKRDLISIEARITLNYHSIEKGLSNIDLRYGFGRRAIRELLLTLDEFIKKRYNPDNPRFLSAIRVLENYLNMHQGKKNEMDLNFIESKLSKYKNYINEKGVTYYYKNQTVIHKDSLSKHNGNIDGMIKRHSVREYKECVVAFDLITNIVNIAQNTPSVCNRQPWKLTYVTNDTLIREILKIQRGLNWERISGIRNLFVVSIDLRCFANGFERHEPYIAGGMYTMNILNLLDEFQLGSCALNSSLSEHSTNKIRKLLKMNNSEEITNFITFGYKLDKYTSPASDRDDISRVLRFIN